MSLDTRILLFLTIVVVASIVFQYSELHKVRKQNAILIELHQEMYGAWEYLDEIVELQDYSLLTKRVKILEDITYESHRRERSKENNYKVYQ